MKINRKTLMSVLVALILAVCLGGCKKKVAPTPPPPPPPPPAAPTASISASPDNVQAGQSVQLTWQTQNATSATITDLGTVDLNGTRTVTPSQSTTYRLQAMGAGGNQEATTRVTVTMPPPPPPPARPAPTPSVSDEQLLQQNVQDIFFDYDSYEVRPADQQKLAAAAAYLNTQKPNWKLQIEGYCDERGSTEYNLALGDNRASAVQQALVRLGVSADRLKTISYGKEKPFCTEHNEECWQQNRRDHFSLQ